MAYKIYDADSVNKATDLYNNVANNTPTFTESSATRNARVQADNYAQSYKNRTQSGYNSKYSDTLGTLADKYMNNETNNLRELFLKVQNINDNPRIHRTQKKR